MDKRIIWIISIGSYIQYIYIIIIHWKYLDNMDYDGLYGLYIYYMDNMWIVSVASLDFHPPSPQFVDRGEVRCRCGQQWTCPR